MGVAGFYADIANLIALQVFDGKTGQTAVDLDTGDLLRQPGQQGGLIARPRTDFKHTVGGLALEFLGKARSEEHTSELQSLMRISYAVFRLKKKKIHDFSNSSTNFAHSTIHQQLTSTTQ